MGAKKEPSSKLIAVTLIAAATFPLLNIVHEIVIPLVGNRETIIIPAKISGLSERNKIPKEKQVILFFFFF